jgi:two-component system alkaline phosphatase synthesis response regulator PhoP
VVSKVRAVLRRIGTSVSPKRIIRVADLSIDLDGHEITREGEAINLTPTEFGLLASLAEQPGRAFSRLQLLEATQGMAYEGYERTIDAHIKNLRAKIEIDPKNPVYIETVFGVGYRFTKQ